MMRASSRPPNRPSTIIARTQLAIACRDAIYGIKARPFGRRLRASWTCLVAFYVRSRMLTYDEVREAAKRMGADMDLHRRGVNPMDNALDLDLRAEFSRRLVQAAKWKEMCEGDVTRFGAEVFRHVDRSTDFMFHWMREAERQEGAAVARRLDRADLDAK